MMPRPVSAVWLATILILVGACHSTAPSTTPHPAPVAVAPAAPSAAPSSGLKEAPRDWQLLDESVDHVPGISVARAEKELLAGRAPKAPVVVAVIDGGIDTAHADLRANLNAQRGWDFIGGADGRDVHWDTYELTRLVIRCRHQQASGPDTLPTTLASQCTHLESDLAARHGQAERQLQQLKELSSARQRATDVLRQQMRTDSLSVGSVQALDPTDSTIGRARQIYLALETHGATAAAIADAITQLQSRLDYALNTSFDPRPIVGDNYADVHQSHYGNSDVMGPDAKHGTHVSGIIGAVRGNGVGIDGIAPAVHIMMIRAVPDGDERDKDIANAIRYAVDHGARVINMSFGKGYSPEKGAVDEAVRYADAHNVLMVHAAGNDGENLDTHANFPTPAYADSGHARNWIEVGASSWSGGDSLAASFSNYSQSRVDVFAPGVDILSTVPGNTYERDSGTSMAAPVVTGLAALILDYYPDLSAADLKKVILKSATRYDQMVVRPGSTNGERVPFSSLSTTGGIVNAYRAFQALNSPQP